MMHFVDEIALRSATVRSDVDFAITFGRPDLCNHSLCPLPKPLLDRREPLRDVPGIRNRVILTAMELEHREG